MKAKFYTQFQVEQASNHRDNVFSGIVELNGGDPASVDAAQIERMLADSFDLNIDHLSLVSWHRLH
ncbi:MAG: hypothetical protein AAF004_11930 [Pseudomonadota bacterium]